MPLAAGSSLVLPPLSNSFNCLLSLTLLTASSLSLSNCLISHTRHLGGGSLREASVNAQQLQEASVNAEQDQPIAHQPHALAAAAMIRRLARHSCKCCVSKDEQRLSASLSLPLLS